MLHRQCTGQQGICTRQMRKGGIGFVAGTDNCIQILRLKTYKCNTAGQQREVTYTDYILLFTGSKQQHSGDQYYILQGWHKFDLIVKQNIFFPEKEKTASYEAVFSFQMSYV
jgi:hypothetical protein